ncbi:MAG: DUF58 domain-containing protein [Candidatus Obscuribacterales bacterium]|nr:DUF58 domain-containing protein [Candidatus Obscuribacterales bacterium]
MSPSRLDFFRFSISTEFRFWIIMTIALVLYGIAASIGNGWIFLLTASLIVILIGAFVLPLLSLSNIALKQVCPPRITAGESCRTTIIASPRYSFFAPQWLIIGADEKASAAIALESLAENQTLTFDCGPYKRSVRLQPTIKIECAFPFGLLWLGHSFKSRQPLIVQPKVVKLDGRFLSSLRSGSYVPGGTVNGQSGFPSSATRNVREYVRGDSRRFIHWSLSARHNRLMVKEYEHEGLPAYDVLFDCTKQYNSAAEFELAVTTVASLLTTGHNDGIHPALYIADEPISDSSNMPPYIVEQVAQLDTLAGLKYRTKTSIEKAISPAIFQGRNKALVIVQASSSSASGDSCPDNCGVLEIGAKKDKEKKQKGYRTIISEASLESL